MLRGILLGISIVFVIFIGVGVGFVDGVADKLQPLLCAPGERVQVVQQNDNDGETSADVYCVGEGGKQISWRWWLLLGVPIPLAFVLSWALGKRGGAVTDAAGLGSVSTGGIVGSPLVGTQTGGNKTLTERLRELDEAYAAGLISKDEFDRTRQHILDSQSDE